MKTLIISVDYPLPEDRGNRMRTMHFARAFKEYGDVDLMCYKSHVPAEKMITPFRKEYYLDMGSEKKVNNDGGNIISNLYNKWRDSKPWIANNYGNNVIKYVYQVIEQEDYDIILCRYSINAFPLLFLPDKYKKRVILDMDDLISSGLYDAVYGNKEGIAKLKAVFDKMVFKKYQVKCLGLNKILFCSVADKKKMRKYNKLDNMYVVPNIIPQQVIPENYKKDGYANKNLLFVGSLYYQPNVMGLIWFIENIFNKLPEEFNDLKLMIVGQQPQNRLIEMLSENERIELVENPPDVVPYIEKCFATIVPILVGGGTRIKILEAGNFYRPVLSTPLGAYGLDLVDQSDVLYFSDFNSFITKLLFLKNKEHYMKLVSSLKSKVESRYTSQAFKKSVKNLISPSLPQKSL